MIWLDGLDIPLVGFFDTCFAERYGEDEQPIICQTGVSYVRYGADMLPVDHQQDRLASPIFNYPCARSPAALEVVKAQNKRDPCHGLKMRYVNLIDDG